MPGIAATAVVDRGAELDTGVEVGPYAIIGPHVRIDQGTTVGAHAYLDGRTEIGPNCRIFPHAVVGTETQDKKYRGGTTYLRIGAGTVIREFATLNPGTAEGTETRVGRNCLLMAYSHVAHNCILGDHVILANAATLAGHIDLGDWAIVGGLTPIHQFVKIGAHAMIGGGSRIPQDVAPFTLVAGNPSRCYGMNVVGMERRGFSPESIRAVKQAYRILFRQKLTVSEAVKRVKDEVPFTPEVKDLINFFLTSERGVTR